MLDTYIKNKGTTKTITHHNKTNHVNEINWDADYDGEVANISVGLTDDGDKETFNFKLTNDDLNSLLNMQSVGEPIHERLKSDFKKPNKPNNQLFLELDDMQNFQNLVQPIKNKEIMFPSSLQEDLVYPLRMTGNSLKKRRSVSYRRKKYKTRKYKQQSKNSSRNSARRQKKYYKLVTI